MPSHLSGGTMQRLTDIREQFPVEVVLWLRTLSNTRDRKSHWKGGEEEKTEEKMGGRERFQGQQGLHGAACRHPSYGHMSNSPLSTSKMTKHIPPCFSITDPTWYSQWLVWFQHSLSFIPQKALTCSRSSTENCHAHAHAHAQSVQQIWHQRLASAQYS